MPLIEYYRHIISHRTNTQTSFIAWAYIQSGLIKDLNMQYEVFIYTASIKSNLSAGLGGGGGGVVSSSKIRITEHGVSLSFVKCLQME